MSKNLRWKVLTILAVLGLATWAFMPPQEKVRLGLDLKGGVHLVMRVQTDDALRVETETTADRLREAHADPEHPRRRRRRRRPERVPRHRRALGAGRASSARRWSTST